MSPIRNQLALNLLRQLKIVSEERLVEVLDDDSGESKIEDRLLAERILTSESHGALTQMIDLLIKTHSTPESALDALSTQEPWHSITREVENVGQVPERSRNYEETQTAPATPPNSPNFQVNSPNSAIKRFRVVAEHARGGLGAVYSAFDEELKREVALKEMHGKFTGDNESRRRFVTEAEITGQLEHPGVVPVYSLGWNAEGHPFYAMRFIRGQSLKETVDKFHKKTSKAKQAEVASDFQSVDFRKLLGRIVDVCHAMEYAHSRGVLHRDLKPSNIMLGPYGETLVVDWGLAKALTSNGEHDGDKTSGGEINADSSGVETEYGSVMGTPHFMAPEQAVGDIENLGPTADIYSIGAMLFYLLTGTYSVNKGDSIQILRDVAGGAIHKARDINDQVPRPLEAICKKAMALAASERYQAAAEMGDDIERWLADEPVSVYRDSIPVRLRRWIRKHRTLAASIAASLTVAFVGLAVSLIVFAGMNRRLEEANGELLIANELETNLRQTAQKSEALAIARKQEADENFALATEAVDTYLTQIDDDVELSQNNFYDLRARLVRTAIPFYEQLIEKQSDNDALDTLQAHAYFRLGAIYADLGKHDQAIQSYQKSKTIYTRLVESNTSVEEAFEGLALNHNNLGNLLVSLGRPADAMVELELGRALMAKLLADSPESENLRKGLAQSLHNLGVLGSDTGDLETAGSLLEQAIEIETELLKTSPNNTFYRLLAAKSGNSLAINCFRENDLAGAIDAFQNALANSDHPSDDDIHGIERRVIRAGIYHNLGLSQSQSGEINLAEENYKASLSISTALSKEVSRVPNIRNQLAATHTNLGNLYRSQNKNELAETHQEQARVVMQQLVEDFPRIPIYRIQYGATLCNLGNAINIEAPKQALERYDECIEILSPLVLNSEAEVTEVGTATLFLRNGYWGKANTLLGLEEFRRASDAYLKASELAVDAAASQLKAEAAYTLSNIGEHEEVIRIGQEVLNEKPLNPATLHRSAKAAGRCLPDVTDEVEKAALQKHVLELLFAVEETGYFSEPQNASQLSLDEDFQELEANVEFIELLERVSSDENDR